MTKFIKTMCAALLLFGHMAFAAPDGLININSATASELAAALNGVGLTRAEAIVSYRQNHGDFVSLEELMEVQGIGEAVFERNRSRITLE